jgi:multiple sugar transport system ATP-binding protein
MTMADQIVVMNNGQIEQTGSPLELYDRPANRFVAGFLGSPSMNFIDGTQRDGTFVTTTGAALPLAAAYSENDGRAMVYGIRPEHLDLVSGSVEGLEAEVVVIEPTGSETQLFARVGGQEIVAIFRERHEFAPGQKIRLKPRASAVHLFDQTSGKRI